MSTTGSRPYWWQRCIPRYGNWGGVGWSAGRWNNDPAATDWFMPPVDAMDELFKAHDWAYQLGLDRDQADRILVSGLSHIVVISRYGRAYRAGARIIFTVWPFVRRFWRGVTMRKLVSGFVGLAALVMALSALGLAVEPPPLSASEFADSPEAAVVWQILAGQGLWGAILFAVVGVVWKVAKPYLDDWMRQRRLATLWDAATTGVVGTMQTYVDAAKAENGGKLTEEMAAHARAEARQYIVSFMKTQGVDVIREYGKDVLDYMIEAILRRLKLDNPVAKAVLAPLPELAP